MNRCDYLSRDTDRELHHFGLCRCALYPSTAPRRLPWTRTDIERLLGLMNVTLIEQPENVFVAHDPARALVVPSIGPGEPGHRLDELVIRVACADYIHGPLTVAQAQEQLARIGVELSGTLRRTGWVWIAFHPASDYSIEGMYTLTHLIDMATSHVRYLGVAGSYQPVITEITRQAPRTAQRRGRPDAARRPHARLSREETTSLDLFTGSTSLCGSPEKEEASVP